MPAGRPTLYTQAIADEVCERMANGESLREICRSDHIPHEATVRTWSTDDREGFATQYARAREALMEYWADEIIDIADDGTNDWMQRKAQDGSVAKVLDAEHVQRSRVRIDSRKWLMSKLAPKRYGDTTKHEVTGKDGGPLEVSWLNPDGS
jgi:hypothetical protein